MSRTSSQNRGRSWLYTTALLMAALALVDITAETLGVPTGVKLMLVAAACAGVWWLAAQLGWQRSRVPPETGRPPRND